MLRSPGMKGRQPTALGLVALLWAASASAQNPREVLLGGRTATMGGTGTATGNDSAMPYLNPAGLAGLPGDVLAVSASLYAHTSRSYDPGFFNPKGFAPAFGDVTVSEESVTSSDVVEMPSSVMYVRHLGGGDVHHVLGMSLVIPQASRSTVQATFEADAPGIGGTIRQSRAYSRASTRYYFGPPSESVALFRCAAGGDREVDRPATINVARIVPRFRGVGRTVIVSSPTHVRPPAFRSVGRLSRRWDAIRPTEVALPAGESGQV
jgi:hypothetical protein